MRTTKKESELTHLIFVFKGKVYSRFKDWSIDHSEAVLTRLGATYWEIGL